MRHLRVFGGFPCRTYSNILSIALRSLVPLLALCLFLFRTRGSRNFYRSLSVHSADVLNVTLRLLSHLLARPAAPALTAGEDSVYQRTRMLFGDIAGQLSDDVMFGGIDTPPPGVLPGNNAAAVAQAQLDALPDHNVNAESGPGTRADESTRER